MAFLDQARPGFVADFAQGNYNLIIEFALVGRETAVVANRRLIDPQLTQSVRNLDGGDSFVGDACGDQEREPVIVPGRLSRARELQLAESEAHAAMHLDSARRHRALSRYLVYDTDTYELL